MRVFLWVAWFVLYIFATSCFASAVDKTYSNRGVMALLWIAFSLLQVWAIHLLSNA